MKKLAYIGTFTDKNSQGIYLATLKDGKLSAILVDDCVSPSYITISHDKKYLYAVVEASEYRNHDGGGIRAYRINDDYSLTFINEQYMDGGYPCHVLVNKDNTYLIISNFAGGFANVFTINPDGGLKPCDKKLVQVNDVADESVSRLHQAVLNDDESLLFFNDYGFDRLIFYNFSKENGVLEEKYIQKFDKLSGPRHSVLYKNKYIYTCSELNNKVYVTCLDDNFNNPPKLLSVHDTLKNGGKTKSYCGAIRLTNDGRIIVSNRGENNLAMFKILDDFTLELVSHIDCAGDFPRDFNITDDNETILVANQKSGTLDLITNNNGIFVNTNEKLILDDAVCIAFV